MKKKLLIYLGIVLTVIQCSSPSVKTGEGNTGSSQLPRVLIITTGISETEEKLAQGIVVAIQSFNKTGAIVRLEPRDILYNFNKLSQYNIVILSTLEGYHDADRKYSLSYMSDEEIHNLTRFVEQGGVMISGENVGRNYPDGTDRVSVFHKLNPENWELSRCFGATFTEKDMTGYSIHGKLPGLFQWESTPPAIAAGRPQLWNLVPDSIYSKQNKILAYWKKDKDAIVALTENHYKNGISFLLASSAFLQPENDGGLWSEDEIGKFYKYVIDSYNQAHGIKVSLNPWPSGYAYAFAASFNAEGNMDQYNRVLSFLHKEEIEPIIFVNGLVDPAIKTYLKDNKIPLASSGFAYTEFKDLKYPQAVDDILRNENFWDTDFHGFRFPYTRPGYWGLLALDGHGYNFESSIGANNIDFFHGSVVPYNIVISNNGFYKSTDILEIAPSYHDDYYFLSFLKDNDHVDSIQLEQNMMVYGKYLGNFWNHAVKPYNGLMVFLGHPQFVGYNNITMTALKDLVKTVKADHAWITSVEEVADFRKKLSQMQFLVNSSKNEQKITIKAPAGITLKDVCLNVGGKVKKVSADKGKVKLVENPKGTQIIFEAFDNQVIEIRY